jgi:hypothetical protein
MIQGLSCLELTNDFTVVAVGNADLVQVVGTLDPRGSLSQFLR